MIDIALSHEDLGDISTIVGQISKINQTAIQTAIPYDHPELTYERVQELKQQLSTAQFVSPENEPERAILGISEIAIKDLSAILVGAYSLDDDDFTREGKVISDDSIDRFEREVSIICHGLKSEHEMKLLEEEQGIEIPRFK